MSWDIKAFKEKLEDQHSFPGVYIFKFIVPSDKLSIAEGLWKEGEITRKPSSKGKYTSVTIKANISSSDQVIAVYEEAHNIDGLIAL